MNRIFRFLEAMNSISPLFDQVTEVSIVLPAYERDISTLSGQRICQCQAANDMPRANRIGGIGADDDLQTDSNYYSPQFNRLNPA